MNEHGRGDAQANAQFSAGIELPWLQDVDADGNGNSDVWYDSWNVVYRDVQIVGRDGEFGESFNLTVNRLEQDGNCGRLKQMLIDAAETPPESDWQSPVEPLDINADGLIAPLDALLVINKLGTFPNGILTPSEAGQSPYLDPSGDGLLAPLDALSVINQLNRNSSIPNVTCDSSAAAAASSASVGGKTEFDSGLSALSANLSQVTETSLSTWTGNEAIATSLPRTTDEVFAQLDPSPQTMVARQEENSFHRFAELSGCR